MTPAQGDVWWAESETGSRPVLVVTRNEAIPVLQRLVVAPITRTQREIASEVALDTEDGMAQPCVASFDNLRVVLKSHLTQRIASLAHRRSEICEALAAMADC